MMNGSNSSRTARAAVTAVIRFLLACAALAWVPLAPAAGQQVDPIPGSIVGFDFYYTANADGRFVA